MELVIIIIFPNIKDVGYVLFRSLNYIKNIVLRKVIVIFTLLMKRKLVYFMPSLLICIKATSGENYPLDLYPVSGIL